MKRFHCYGMKALFALTCSLFGVYADEQRNQGSLGPLYSPVPTAWRTLRGGFDILYGGAGNLYELNPNYLHYAPPIPPLPRPSLQQAQNYEQGLTVGDLDSSSLMTTIRPFAPFSYASSGTGRSSLYQFIIGYTRHLIRYNPVLAAVACMCLSVFGAWQLLPRSYLPILQRHFVVNRTNVAAGRWLSVFLSAVSHIDPWHIFFNLAALFSMGPNVQNVLERHCQQQTSSSSIILPWMSFNRHNRMQQHQLMSLLMVGAALSGSLMFLALGGASSSGLGLSAVTMALLAVYAEASPDGSIGILLGGIFPVRLPAYVLLQLLSLWSAFGSLVAMRSPQRVAHSAHLGGILFGIAFSRQILRLRPKR